MNTTLIFAGAGIVALGVASAVASALTARRAAAGLKMAAASAYILLAFMGGAWNTGYGRAVLVALALCWVGDLLLIAPGRGTAFLAGLVSFLLGHVVYAWAFWLHGVGLLWLSAGALAAAAVGLVVARWLARHDVPDDMRTPVRAYIAFISLMVAMAVGTRGAGGAWIIPAGAAAFMASDVFVARERFVKLSPVNVLVGLPLYFLGQVLLALSV